jgi:hypothetical protein
MNKEIKEALDFLLESIYWDENDLEYYPDSNFTDAIDLLKHAMENADG